jgi:iron complex outermembrane receptor protein
MKLFFCSLIMMGVFPLYAQHSLSGTITDHNTGEPLTGVTVYIPDLGKGTATDSEGHYTLTHISEGKFLIEYRLTAYRPRAITLLIKANTLYNIDLESGVAELGEIIITGTSKATEIRKNPLPVTAIDLHQMNRSLSTNLIDAIAKIPGVSAVTTGPGISKPGRTTMGR